MGASRVIAGLVLAAIATFLSGCGGGSSSSSLSAAPSKTVVATASASFLVAPKALALSSKDGQLYVADGAITGTCSPSCIWKVDPATGTVNPTPVVVGTGTIEGITFDATADNLYYSDRPNLIGKLMYSGGAYQTLVLCDNVASGVQDPYHLVVDLTLGILSAEGSTPQVVRLSTCAPSTTATAFSAASPPFVQPRGIAFGAAGEIYVGDTTNNAIYQVSSSNGGVSTYSSLNLNQPMGMQWLGGTSTYGNALVVALQGSSTVVSTNGTTTKTIASFPNPPIDVSVSSDNLNIYVLTSAGIYKVTGL